MTAVALSRLLDGSRSAARAIAIRNGSRIPLSTLRADVAHNAERLRAAAPGSALLVCADSYRFAAGLLSLLHADIPIVVPTNAQPATLAALDDGDVLLVTDALPADDAAFRLEPGAADPGPLAAYDPALRTVEFFTSGSTGNPKRIPRSAALLEAEIALICGVLNTPECPPMACSTAPHQHVYGMTFKVLWPLAAGIPFSTINHELWETLCAELRPGAVLVTSPSHLTRLAGLPPLPADARPGRILSAGAPLPDAAAAAATAFFGIPVTEMFGSTECGAFATRPAAGRDAPWRAFPGVEVAIAGDGRLKIRSPAVPADVQEDGWYVSSDLAEHDPSGGFRIRGRADRIVKVEGKRISLVGIERLLTELPFIDEAAVILVGSDYRRLGAAVVLNAEGRRLLADAGNFGMGQHIRRTLQHLQEPAGVPRVWRFVDSLPQGSLGKPSGADLARLFRDAGSK